jgi:hypothetical protein
MPRPGDARALRPPPGLSNVTLFDSSVHHYVAHHERSIYFHLPSLAPPETSTVPHRLPTNSSSSRSWLAKLNRAGKRVTTRLLPRATSRSAPAVEIQEPSPRLPTTLLPPSAAPSLNALSQDRDKNGKHLRTQIWARRSSTCSSRERTMHPPPLRPLPRWMGLIRRRPSATTTKPRSASTSSG